MNICEQGALSRGLRGPMPHASRQLQCLTSDAWNSDQAAETGTFTSSLQTVMTPANISLDNGFTLTSAYLSSVGPLGINFSEIPIENQIFTW